ncbi:hypothetical protein NE237_003793 [Protea cynaroides]|uniref:Alcohol dehydrogenase n=1 Tax=Protea cynaroides TaxID=273540 RepID=A0A9Q0QT24_9MAGN|nr:hypothetical protein NE237_003793 [Protea cynaroides]
MPNNLLSIVMEKGKPQETRENAAAICRKAGEPLQIEEVEVAPPKAWEVRIRIICTSLSQRCNHLEDEVPLAIFPRILGHKAVGVDIENLKYGSLITGVGLAWKTAIVEAGSTVDIFGLGAIGFAVAEGGRLRGATKIIGVDLNPNKLQIGKR